LRPSASQIEICTFGPGYGECSVIHLGNNHWIVVDSCIDKKSGNPAALEYFAKIGVDPLNVKLVVATHWHDDHVRGMARQLAQFKNAQFCSSPALTKKEFTATAISYESRHGIVAGSGATELCEVLEILRQRSAHGYSKKAAPGRLVFSISAQDSGHGGECQVMTLSPSDKQVDRFLIQMGGLLPLPLEAKKRAPDSGENDLSVVVHVTVGKQTLLLGADLEEDGDSDLGWSAIVAMNERPQGKAQIFKIPHHGSKNGHYRPVWDLMLVKNPISILTPWSKGSGLPAPTDITRITSLTDSAFITSAPSRLPRTERPYAVEKQIKETVGSLRPIEQDTGWIRLRNGGTTNPEMWEIEMSDGAGHLANWKP
jgi:Metallo-beta-lactamase superfamily